MSTVYDDIHASYEDVEVSEFVSPVEGEIPRYEFDADFQGKIAALVVRDDLFNKKTDGLVLPEYFESSIDSQIVSLVLSHFKKYKQTPDKATLKEILRKCFEKGILRPESKGVIIARVSGLLGFDISDREFVIDEVASFAKHQAVQQAMIESVPLIAKKQFDRIHDIMQKAMQVGANHDFSGYDYFAELENRTQERLDRKAGKLPPTGITTGYSDLDRHLYHKGWGRKELSVLMGAAKMGKTTALIQFAINAIMSVSKHNVLYLSLEVAEKIIADRVDANITETAMFELGERIHTVKDLVGEVMRKSGQLIIHEFPSGSLTCSDIYRLIERYKTKGITFDMIVVDYADLMSPDKRSDNAIENSKSIYVNLRALAFRENCAVLTATQTNRDGAKAAVAKMTDVADDFNKIRIADIVISINKTDEERSASQARLFFAASRNGASGFTVRVEQNTDRMQFITKILGEE